MMPTDRTNTPTHAAFMALGTTEEDNDRSELERLLVHAGIRFVWRSVRGLGCSVAVVAREGRLKEAKVAEYLQRGDRALEALGESPEAVARRYVDGLSPGLAEAMRSGMELGEGTR